MQTLCQLLDGYIAALRARSFSETTLRVRFGNSRAFLAWLAQTHGARTAERLLERHLRDWQLELSRRRTPQGLPLRPRSINKQVEAVRTFLEHLQAEGHVPPRLAAVLQYQRVPLLLPRVVPHADMRRLLDGISAITAGGLRNRAMLELLYSSGLRAAELIGLDLADIDLERETILVRGKGRKERLVPVGATARRFLTTYLRAVRGSFRPPAGENAVFLGAGGKRLRYHTLRRIVVAVAASAGLAGKLTAHVFRRSCATELVRGNANLYHVSRLLGHESLDTLQHYARLDVSDLRRTHHRTHPRERDEDARGA